MNKNKITISASILAAVIVIIGAASISYAAGKGGGNGFFRDRADKNPPAEVQADRTALEQAFTNNDYTAWKNLMETKRDEMAKRVDDFSSQISEDTFAKLVEIRNLMTAGKNDEANKLRQELDFGFGMGFGQGFGLGTGCHK
ncbi:MAG: hypothetical protein WC582_03065 [Patescibacteria group bacterium]